jgi:hypothetical protein
MEQWRQVVGWPEYEVSSFGNVRRISIYHKSKAGHLRKLSINQHGYIRIGLCRENRVTWVFVHRLVAEAFLPKPLCGQTQIAHKNSIKTDNRIENLRWDTPVGNASDRWGDGTYKTGELHQSSKVNWCMANEIRKKKMAGISAKNLMAEYGLSKTTIYSIIRGSRWGTPGPKGQAHSV